jgi:hypothetical protein
MDSLSFDKIIQAIQKEKINLTMILDMHKMLPRRETQMNIPPYWMISMPIMCPTLKIDVLKMASILDWI